MTVNKSSEASVGEKNKQKIVQAAEQVFAQQGFKGSSVQQIADTAGLPKTNVLYYFKTKQSLYQAVLQHTLSLWNSRFDQAQATDDPAEILAEYISEKIDMSRTHPLSSKIFAMEILNGGPNLDIYFNHEQVSWMKGRVAIIESWINQQKIVAVDPYYLLFTIWASTQHYADFSEQVTRLRGEKMKKVDFDHAKRTVIQLVLTGCGLTVPLCYQSSQ